MALQGTLDTFALADLVRLLATTSKTGELVIDGDRGTGRLWFADGFLVAGEPASEAGSVDALFALLRFEEGGFRFEPDIAAPEGSAVPGDAVALLAEAEERIEAWRPIEAVVPSPAVTVALRAELAEDDVRLDRDQWRLVTTIAGGTTAGAVAETLDLDEVGAATRIKELVDAGALEVGPEVATEPDGPPPGSSVAEEPEPGEVAAESAPDADDAGAAEVEAEAPPVFEPVEVVDPLVEPVALDAETEVPDTDAGTPSPSPGVEVVGEPRPTLRSLSRPEPDAAANGVDPSTNGNAAPILSFEGAVDPDEALPSLPTEPLRVEPGAGPGGSTAVDLDAPAQGDPDGHRYLGTTDEVDGLPEPLPADGPEDLPAEVQANDPVAESDGLGSEGEGPVADDGGEVAVDEIEAARAPWPSTPADDELAMQLDALSPAAARAVAAAATDSDVGDDSDAGRKVLRRIISTGRS